MEETTDNIVEVAYFVPLEESAVAGFTAGTLRMDEFERRICAAKRIARIDSVALETLRIPGATGGGETVDGPDGKAFILEWLKIEYPDGPDCLVCKPMEYKSAKAVRETAAALAGFSEPDLRKRLPRQLRRTADMLYSDFRGLWDCYDYAAGNGLGMVLFTGHLAPDVGED